MMRSNDDAISKAQKGLNNNSRGRSPRYNVIMYLTLKGLKVIYVEQPALCTPGVPFAPPFLHRRRSNSPTPVGRPGTGKDVGRTYAQRLIFSNTTGNVSVPVESLAPSARTLQTRKGQVITALFSFR